MYYRLPAGVCLAASLLFAQASVFDQPPPGVEDALRARVAKFYQAFVDGKFRLADQVVAEDCKDEFFAANKRRFDGFRISQVVFEENYTKARVVTMVDTEMAMVSQRVKVKAPQTTLWKLENGEWWWYIYKDVDEVDTPFGRVKRPKLDKVKDGPPPPAVQAPNLESMAQMVKADKTTIQLNPKVKSTQIVTVTNNMPGPVSLRLDPVAAPGLTAKLDRTEVGPKETARVEISYVPGNQTIKGHATVAVVAIPSGTVIPIQVFFNAPSQ